MPIACWWPQVAFGKSTCWQSHPITRLHQDAGGKHVGVTNSRGFAKVEGKKTPNLNILFMLCSFFTFLLFLVRLFYTGFSCLLLTSVRESAKSSQFTHRERLKPEHH